MLGVQELKTFVETQTRREAFEPLERTVEAKG